MKNNILIIGNGFVGSKLQKYLSDQQDANIFQLSNLNYFDLKQTQNEIENFIVSKDINWVINCVGYTGTPNVDGCEANKEDTWALNVTYPTMLASVTNRLSAKLINISSGCIYTGYEKDYTEVCEPNFGLWTPESSWYSKTKHACELSFKNFVDVFNFRIRMPVTGDLTEKKNYLTKILLYDNLIDYKNSKTVIEDLLLFTHRFINRAPSTKKFSGNYNVVNPNPLTTKDIVEILNKFGYSNPNWKWIDLETLYKSTKCGRSNCVLDNYRTTYATGIEMPSEKESIMRILGNEK